MINNILNTVEDVIQALKELDKLYYENKIDKIDYENTKQDLYIHQYKLEKKG